jgi:hypothetical protein
MIQIIVISIFFNNLIFKYSILHYFINFKFLIFLLTLQEYYFNQYSNDIHIIPH